MPVKLTDILEAIEMSGPETRHYLDKRTGEIVTVTAEELKASEKLEYDEGEDSLATYPEWQRDAILKAREILSNEDHFLGLPEQSSGDDFSLMRDFCAQLPNRRAAQELIRATHGRGAFTRFRSTAQSLGLEDRWYDYKRQAYEQIAIDWLEENNIAYTHDDAADASDATM